MSLAALFRYHDHPVPLYALPNGRLVKEPTGMPVSGHTFHGGAVVTDTATGGEAWWLKEGAVARDEHAMSLHFPGFTKHDATIDLLPAWSGKIDSGYGAFDVLIVHRNDRGLPRVVPQKPGILTRREGKRTISSPHLYLNGDLCIASREDWDPERDNIATVISWTAHWYACFIQWRLTGKWPQESYVPMAKAA